MGGGPSPALAQSNRTQPVSLYLILSKSAKDTTLAPVSGKPRTVCFLA